MVNKIKLKYLGKNGFDFKFEEIESGKEVKLKIWKDKPFKDTLNEGSEYFAILNENWINELESIEPEDIKPESKSAQKTLNTTQTIKLEKESKEIIHKDSVFSNLYKINCKIDKKGRFNYVSWTEAWGEVMRLYPDSTFKVYENQEGFPAFVMAEVGAFVKVGVTVNGIEHIENYPVLDFNNKAIIGIKLNVFDINKAIKRCMTKALAFHGLGLYVYAGEDLPENINK